ncbi:MAG: hypothetical protein WC055_00730 [Melioribacteraceae bacterium]
MEHTWHKCDCGEGPCVYCGGGLGVCDVCGGVEGSLSSECCGYKLDEFVLEAIYNGGLDFKDGKWIVLKQECPNCREFKIKSLMCKCLELPRKGNNCKYFKYWK